jgi:dolichol-phosphate mannosyltransferase
MTNITIVIPTYNETENLPVLIPRLLSLDIDQLKILIVDDVSPDGTGRIADELSQAHPGRIQVLHRIGLQRGLGAAYIDGFRKALLDGADIIFGIDADLSHDPDDIPRMLARITQCDMIVGSRYTPGGGVVGHWGWYRVLLSNCAQWYIQMILGLKTRDATSAFRCYKRTALEQVNLVSMEPVGFSFLIEVLYNIEKLGLKVDEYPIRFRDRERGQSKVSLRVISSAMVNVLKIRKKFIIHNKAIIVEDKILPR